VGVYDVSVVCVVCKSLIVIRGSVFLSQYDALVWLLVIRGP
jgi:hypothetical protein